MTGLPPEICQGILDHVAVAMPRIRDALVIYRDVLGGQYSIGGDNRELGFRAIVLQFGDGSRIELLEPLGDGFIASFLRDHPRGGVHHLTFKVPELMPAVRSLRAKGFSVFGVSLANPLRQEAFIHPREAQGTLLQIVYEAPEFVPEGGSIENVLSGQGINGNGVASV